MVELNWGSVQTPGRDRLLFEQSDHPRFALDEGKLADKPDFGNASWPILLPAAELSDLLPYPTLKIFPITVVP
jgi:hypothetical protein